MSETGRPEGPGSSATPAPPERCPACDAPGPRRDLRFPTLRLFRCRACRSAFLHPPPGGVELRARYEREHAEGKWGEIFRSKPAEEAQWRLDLLERLLPGRGRMLDVGCGDGTFLTAAEGRGWHGVGLEISLEAARESRLRPRPLSVAVAGPRALSPAAGFDALTFWDVLEHVPDPLGLLREGVAALRPGGLAAATMPNVHGTTAWLHGTAWTYYDVGLYGHLVHFSLKGLARLFERAGLDVAHARTRGSTDLRDVGPVRGARPPSEPVAKALDRVSGVLARVAEPAGWGNTLVVVGRRR